jgi:hypothetical protein
MAAPNFWAGAETTIEQILDSVAEDKLGAEYRPRTCELLGRLGGVVREAMENVSEAADNEDLNGPRDEEFERGLEDMLKEWGREFPRRHADGVDGAPVEWDCDSNEDDPWS